MKSIKTYRNNNRKEFVISICLFFSLLNAVAQNKLTKDDLINHTTYFNLSENNQIDKKGKKALSALINSAQFVGLAEVHQSQQLSFFTVGFLELLKEKNFNTFALEIGPNSAKVLQELSKVPNNTAQNIKKLNNTYGSKNNYKQPIIFTHKQEDALFVSKASELKYEFWGLDQEYDFSILMNLDTIYEKLEDKSQVNEILYRESRNLLNKHLNKNKIKGLTRNCWFLQNETIKAFLDKANQQENLASPVKIMRLSWDIYCKEETGNAGQYRANFMKAVFDSNYRRALDKGIKPKVFLKMGGVHLTHSRSFFGIDDIGLHIHEKAKENNTKFITIRQLTRYKNGRDLTGAKNWNLPSFQAMGKKDQWTLIDLKPLKEKLKNGLINPNKNERWEINNYDAIIIPPNDKEGSLNY